jgi:hypothetical protein
LKNGIFALIDLAEKMIPHLLNTLREPSLLRGDYPYKIKFLHRQGDLSLLKGFGNAPTDQEASFAIEAEKLGFKFIPNTETPREGLFYKYQLNGSQSKIDFVLYEGSKSVKLDLKSGKNESFYWNDGWFEKDVVYVISYKSKKVERIYIGLGHESYEECDNLAWNTIRETIKNMNKEAKNTKFLKIYNRLANQYSCKQFTPEFTEERFNSVIKFLG